MTDKFFESQSFSLRVEDVAELLSLSRSGAYALCHRAGFPAVRVGKRLIIPRQAFFAWLERQLQEGGAAL